MLPGWLTLTAGLLAASPHLRLDVGLEATTGARSVLTHGLEQGTSGNLELEPSLSARVHLRAGELRARYSARLLVNNADLDQVAGVRHLVTLEGGWDLGPGLRLIASERFLHGRNDTLRPELRPWEAFDLQETPAPGIPDDLGSITQAGLFLQASRRLTLAGSLMYAMHGAASPSSWAEHPPQHGPLLFAGASYEATRSDTVGSSLYAQYLLAGESRSALLRLTGRWRRQLSRVTVAELDAGGGVSCEGLSSCRGDALRLMPLLLGELTHVLPRRSQRLELRLLAGIQSHTGWWDGVLFRRLATSGTVTWVLRERLTLRARATAARDVPVHGGTAVSLALLELHGGYAFGPRLKLDTGAQVRWQAPPDLGSSATFHWIAFASLIFTTEDTRYDK